MAACGNGVPTVFGDKEGIWASADNQVSGGGISISGLAKPGPPTEPEDAPEI